MNRRKVFMPVFNEIDYDGRVQRAAEALGEAFDVTVFSIDSGKGYENSLFASHTVRLPRLKRLKALRHLYFWLRVCIAAVRIRPAIIHAHDLFLAFPGWVASRLTGAGFVYDAHELIIPEKGKFHLRGIRPFYMIERFVIGKAGLVIAANEERARLMQRHYGLKNMPLVIRNISPKPAVSLSPEKILLLYPQLRPKEMRRVRLVFQGNMTQSRGVGEIISAMQYTDDSYELLLVGSSPDLEKLKRLAERLGLSNRVIFLGKVPRDHLYDIMRTCDIGIITYPMDGLNNIYCAPNKVHEYAHAGLPMLTTCQPTLQVIVDTYKIGITFGGSDGNSEEARAEIAQKAQALASRLDEYRLNLERFLRENRWEVEKEVLCHCVRSLSQDTFTPCFLP